MPFVVEFAVGPIGCHLRHFVRGKGDRACAGFTVEHIGEGSPAAQTKKISELHTLCKSFPGYTPRHGFFRRDRPEEGRGQALQTVSRRHQTITECLRLV